MHDHQNEELLENAEQPYANLDGLQPNVRLDDEADVARERDRAEHVGPKVRSRQAEEENETPGGGILSLKCAEVARQRMD